MSDITLRPATPEDEPFLRELFHDVHAPEFAPLQLEPQALLPLLDMQFRGQAMTYATQFPSAASFVVARAGTPIGRFLLVAEPDSLRVVDLALLTQLRGQGIGTTLLRWIAAQAEAQSLPVRLSVRFGNPAQRLYQRLGFLQTGGDSMSFDLELPAPTSLETTSEAFRALLGQTVEACAQDGTAVPLVVTAVRPMPSPSTGPALTMNDSFIVDFTGPRQPELLPATTRLLTADRRAVVLLLSPTSCTQSELVYEAVFNRMTLRP